MEGDQPVGFTHSAVRRRKRDGIKFSLSTFIIFLCLRSGLKFQREIMLSLPNALQGSSQHTHTHTHNKFVEYMSKK